MRWFVQISSILAVTAWLSGCAGGIAEPSADLCTQFKIGTFKYAGNKDIRIERTENVQYEYSIKGENGYQFTDKYHIVWTSDCEYYLTLDSTDHPQDLNFSPTDTMWTKITGILRNGYTFTAVKGEQIFKGELKRTSL